MECNGDDAPPDASEGEASGDKPGREPRARKPTPLRLRAGASYGVFATELAFGTNHDAFMERRAATVSLSYRYTDTITLQAGAGATLGGRFVFDREHFTFDPGWIASAAATWKVVGTKRDEPFLLVSGALAASGGVTRDPRGNTESMYGIDLRLSVTAGKTFFDVLSPYLLARAFGGPVIWKYRGEDQLGGDKYHFQIGAGLVVALPGRFDVFAEGVPLGERAVVAGAGYTF